MGGGKGSAIRGSPWRNAVLNPNFLRLLATVVYPTHCKPTRNADLPCSLVGAPKGQQKVSDMPRFQGMGLFDYLKPTSAESGTRTTELNRSRCRK